MVKIIFVDIDGTLRNEERVVTERTKESIKKVCSLGILIVLCTGRPREYAIDVSKEANASDYLITSSGAEVFDCKKNLVVYSNNMDSISCKQLYDLAIKYNTGFIMHSNGKKIVRTIKRPGEILFEGEIDEFLSNNKVLQFVITDTDFDKMKDIIKQVDNIYDVKVSNHSKSLTDDSIKPTPSVYFDVVKKEVSKGEGVISLCKYLNIPLKDSVGIGDDNNDIGMFETVGHSIAMGNANEKIKSITDEVIGSNDKDGLAIYLEVLYEKLR